MLKLKLGSKPGQASQDGSSQSNQPAPSPATPSAPTPTTGGGFKLKLNVSQPPTPIEQSAPPSFPITASANASDKKKRPYIRKTDATGKGKKRAAEDDVDSPAAKRIMSGPSRKISLKPPQISSAGDGSKPTVLSLKAKRKASVPKIVELKARGKIPPRMKGVGYDSEDSDTERDPAVQQAFMLRMQPGDDASYLREAIAAGKIGPKGGQGDELVSLKFLEKNCRRAVVTIREHKYGAALVDLPCIVESMKSFDKKGWWKVADISQMLLVLGRVEDDDEAKALPLPREVNKENWQYAHGLTPPMHWARKRRFRKRLNYNETVNIDEEVQRLLVADLEWERSGGTVYNSRAGGREQRQESEQPNYSFELDDDAEGEAVETTEQDGQYEEEYEEVEEEEEDQRDHDAMVAEMQAMFEQDDEPSEIQQVMAESPAPISDQAASMAAIEHAMQDDADVTSVGTPMETPREEPSEEDEEEEEEEESEEDEDSPDVVDEDAVARAQERAQQLEEVADLEKEVGRARQKVNAMTNQLLRQREMQRLAALEEELITKKRVFGLDEED